jgi:hypothetical protein
LCESCDFTVLCQEQFQGTSDLFHCLILTSSIKKKSGQKWKDENGKMRVGGYLELSGGADARDRETDVNGWTDTPEKQFCFQENLTFISDQCGCVPSVMEMTLVGM